MAVLSGHSYQTTQFWIHKYSHCCSCCSDTSNKVFSELSVITPWAVSSSLWAVRSCLSQHFTPLLHASNQNTAIQNSCTRLNQAVSLAFSISLSLFFVLFILNDIPENISNDRIQWKQGLLCFLHSLGAQRRSEWWSSRATKGRW